MVIAIHNKTFVTALLVVIAFNIGLQNNSFSHKNDAFPMTPNYASMDLNTKNYAS